MAWLLARFVVIYIKEQGRGSVEKVAMHVEFSDWDDEDFGRGNTRHIISAGYDPADIEDAVRRYHGPIGITRETGRSMIDADIDGDPTRPLFEIDADDDLVIVTPTTAFPVED